MNDELRRWVTTFGDDRKSCKCCRPTTPAYKAIHWPTKKLCTDCFKKFPNEMIYYVGVACINRHAGWEFICTRPDFGVNSSWEELHDGIVELDKDHFNYIGLKSMTLQNARLSALYHVLEHATRLNTHKPNIHIIIKSPDKRFIELCTNGLDNGQMIKKLNVTFQYIENQKINNYVIGSYAKNIVKWDKIMKSPPPPRLRNRPLKRIKYKT